MARTRGFGNLSSQTATEGSAPALSVSVNAVNKRITTGGYSDMADGINLYFGGKLVGMHLFSDNKVVVHQDCLGTVSKRGSSTRNYFPYGEEPTTTTQNETKYATYYRDSTTALDYAQQRYYARTIGRFTGPDPAEPFNLGDPQSFNLYSYVQNDPVNMNDPAGLSEVTVSYWGPTQSPSGWFSVLPFSFVDLVVGLPSLFPIIPPVVLPVALPAVRTPPYDPNRILRASDAAQATRTAIDQLSGNCISKLTKALQPKGYLRNLLKDRVSAVTYWDARVHGSVWQDSIVRGAPHVQLANAGSLSTDAYIIPTVAGVQTNNIVLKADFFFEYRKEQNLTLVHEILHLYTGKNDNDLAAALGVYKKGDSSSRRITDWLRGDCTGRLVPE